MTEGYFPHVDILHKTLVNLLLTLNCAIRVNTVVFAFKISAVISSTILRKRSDKSEFYDKNQEK